MYVCINPLNTIYVCTSSVERERERERERYPIIIMSEPFDEENILLKTYGTRTYAYCKRRNLYIFIGAFDDAVVAKERAMNAYINTDYTDDGGAIEEQAKKVLPARPPTNTHGVVLWSTKTLEYGNKDDDTYRRSVYEGYISKSSRNPHGRGTMWYFDGRIYEGEWYEGLHYGHGTLISNDGKTSWTGQFKNHRKHGAGEFKQVNDATFAQMGIWKNNLFFRGFNKAEVNKFKGNLT